MSLPVAGRAKCRRDIYLAAIDVMQRVHVSVVVVGTVVRYVYNIKTCPHLMLDRKPREVKQRRIEFIVNSCQSSYSSRFESSEKSTMYLRPSVQKASSAPHYAPTVLHFISRWLRGHPVSLGFLYSCSVDVTNVSDR